MGLHGWKWKLLMVALAAQVGWASAALGQQQAGLPPLPKPVMENVFFNVVWGSLFGILMGAATTVIGSEDKTAPDGLRDTVFEGATLGGIVGLGVGLWLVTNGITFDESSVIFARYQPAPDRAEPLAMRAPPFVLETQPGEPLRITGFRATIFERSF